MTLPQHLVLVRHAESEGNLLEERSRIDGAQDAYSDAHRARHSSAYRLTPKGIRQAQAAGEWLRRQGFVRFDQAYVSEYMRAIETAAHLGLTEATWTINDALHERDAGLMNSLPLCERSMRYPEHQRLGEASAFYGSPPDGESLAAVRIRLRAGFLPALSSEEEGRIVLAVSHGRTLRVLRGILEDMPFWVYEERERTRDPDHTITNAHIFHYARVDPRDPQHVTDNFCWLRSVCPWDAERTESPWRAIQHPAWKNDDLLKVVERFPRLVS